MEEQTTTDSVAQETPGVTTQDGVAIDDQGMAIAANDDVDTQPEEAADEAGSNTNESDSNDSGEVEQDTSQPEVDKDLNKWAQAKGLELRTESEIKMAKMTRESEKAMHSAKNEAKSAFQEEAMKVDPGADPVAERLASLEAKVAINDFYTENPEARQYDQKMAEALSEDPALLDYVRNTGNIKAVYGIVKSQDSVRDTESAKVEGGQEALTQLANKQQATAVRGNAVNSRVSPSDKITAQNVDELIAKNGQKWYMANRDAINKALDPTYDIN